MSDLDNPPPDASSPIDDASPPAVLSPPEDASPPETASPPQAVSSPLAAAQLDAAPTLRPAGPLTVPLATGVPTVSGAPAVTTGDEITVGFRHSETGIMPAVAGAPRRRRTAVVVGLVAVLFVSAAAVAGAWIWNGWGTTEPEDILPASVALFARVDASPGLGQQLKVANLAAKFPHVGSADAIDSLKRSVTDGLGLKSLTFDDVSPWFGDRFASAQWTYDNADYEITALASNNDTLATATLTRVRNAQGAAAFGFAFSHGYAVVVTPNGDSAVSSQDAADAAVKAGQSAPLSHDGQFTNAMNAFPDSELAVGWFSLGALVPIAGVPVGAVPTTPAPSAATHVAVAIRATSDGIELRLRADGSSNASGNALATLGNEPAATVIGVSADLRLGRRVAGCPRLDRGRPRSRRDGPRLHVAGSVVGA